MKIVLQTNSMATILYTLYYYVDCKIIYHYILMKIKHLYYTILIEYDTVYECKGVRLIGLQFTIYE